MKPFDPANVAARECRKCRRTYPPIITYQRRETGNGWEIEERLRYECQCGFYFETLCADAKPEDKD